MSQDKNKLQEFAQNIGYLADSIRYESLAISQGQTFFKSKVQVSFNLGIRITEEGIGATKLVAQNNAAAAALKTLKANHPELAVNWKTVDMEAQAGDALIKLAAYLTDKLSSSEAKSRWLQRVESDANLEAMFDKLHQEQDPSVAMFGKNIGKKHKATWMEALIWEWFNNKGLPPTLKQNLQVVFDFLEE
ncbi:MAG: putative dsRNA-binding protein [Saprospiraceae bacterium]